MKIALLNPNRDLKDAAVHLGLGYLASYIRTEHNDLVISILDTRISSKKKVNKFLLTRYDLVGITATSQVFLEAVDLATTIKENHPDTPVCLGGAHASTYMEEVFEKFPFDFVVFGEGEITFSELIGHLMGNKHLSDINGLIYKDISGVTKINSSRQIIPDINLLPLPAYDLFDMTRYPQHRIVTSRGCPFKCVFCNSSTLWTNRWRKRSVDNLLSEIELLIGSYGRKTIVFNDDSFNIDAGRVTDFCDELVKRDTNILWSTSVRADLVTPAIAARLKSAGCYNVSIGIESSNDNVLRQINKNTTKEKIQKGISALRESGIDVMGQFMIGNPGDTLVTVKESVDFALSSGLTGVEFYTALPYKGSLLWDFVRDEARLLTDAESYNYHTLKPRIIYDTPEFPLADRIKAIDLARSQGFYNALTTDHKRRGLDMGRKFALSLQTLAGKRTGNSLYLWIRKMYLRFIN